MSAARDILSEAAGYGVIIRRRGDTLALEAPTPPPPDLLQRISATKPDLLQVLPDESVAPSIKSPGELSRPVVGSLRVHAALATSTPTGLDWDAEAWREFFDERAGIVEHDGLLSRLEAEEMAYSCCVAYWLSLNFRPTGPDACAWCGDSEADKSRLIPHGGELSGHVWLHVDGDCWHQWYSRRRQEAEAALAALGVPAPSSHS